MNENTADKIERLDVCIAKKLNVSRTIAVDIIEKGYVKVDGKALLKAGVKVKQTSEILIEDGYSTFVSRGGTKLAAALREFNIDLTGLLCMDVGASTGGFTDCMLKNGAKTVYAVDVGTGQLKGEIRNNPAVISMENTDIRDLVSDILPQMEFVCVDLSFISLNKVLNNIYALMADGAPAVLLVKPQFEAGPNAVNKKGIIKSERLQQKILADLYNYTNNIGFYSGPHIESPIKGGSGNKEFLMKVQKRRNS